MSNNSPIIPYEYFYDSQQKRFLEQIVRGFSGFQYETGALNGQTQTLIVPCHMALTNRQVALIRANGSENALNVAPQITVWQSALRPRREDVQNPSHVDYVQVTERNIVGGKYGNSKGNSYSVERLMAMPLTMEITVDLWTTNLDQKHQLVEQMLSATGYQFQIQNSDNALDWTADALCFVEDIEWGSRTVPIGTSNDIDIFSLKLKLPFYLSAPAKIKRQHRIEEVVVNIGELEKDPYDGSSTIGNNYGRTIITPGDMWISVDGSNITLLGEKASDTLPDGSIPSWVNLFKFYGTFNPTVSQIRLSLTDDIEGPFVAGTLQYGSESNTMIWTIDADTLPSNTLLPVDAVINPLVTFPGHGLPAVVDGQRYLIQHDIGPSAAWGNITASENDIIQYNTIGGWTVIFDSCNSLITQYVLNLHTGRQLMWNGKEWIMSIDNYYSPGYWRIFL